MVSTFIRKYAIFGMIMSIILGCIISLINQKTLAANISNDMVVVAKTKPNVIYENTNRKDTIIISYTGQTNNVNKIKQPTETILNQENINNIKSPLSKEECLDIPIIEESMNNNITEFPIVEEFTIDSPINSRSNLTVEDVLSILETTRYCGNESVAKSILDTEYKYNINARVIIGVAKYEATPSLNSKVSFNKNNLFGIVDSERGKYRYYETPEECIDSFGKLLSSELYVGGTRNTLKKINPVYCPPNDQWAYNVANLTP